MERTGVMERIRTEYIKILTPHAAAHISFIRIASSVAAATRQYQCSMRAMRDAANALPTDRHSPHAADSCDQQLALIVFP
eukprot:6181900-Pleurochrysis_carterae.AAC.1